MRCRWPSTRRISCPPHTRSNAAPWLRRSRLTEMCEMCHRKRERRRNNRFLAREFIYAMIVGSPTENGYSALLSWCMLERLLNRFLRACTVVLDTRLAINARFDWNVHGDLSNHRRGRDWSAVVGVSGRDLLVGLWYAGQHTSNAMDDQLSELIDRWTAYVGWRHAWSGRDDSDQC